MVKVLALSLLSAVAAGPSHTKPLGHHAAAAYLNELYMGFDVTDESKPPGVVMRTSDHWGFFCPGFKSDTGCYNGFARCISSASILNNRVMLNNGDQLFMGLMRKTAIMFNTSMVETKLARCSYQYDGGTWGRYNRGCGATAPNGPGMCSDKSSAWFDIDPQTGEECTDKSDVVVKDSCPVRIEKGTAPTRSNDPPCFWKGPAFAQTRRRQKSETHKMMSQRITNQKDFGDQVSTWNEVVIDAELLLKELQSDPAIAITAFVYEKNWDEGQTAHAKALAEKMAKEMQDEFKMAKPVPVIGVDTQLHVHAPGATGPFFYGSPPSTHTTSTQTTSTVPRTGPACCFNGCDGSCGADGDYCSKSKKNCHGCSGKWCPAVLTTTMPPLTTPKPTPPTTKTTATTTTASRRRRRRRTASTTTAGDGGILV